MRISDEFPSRYLKASDLQGREVRVTMQHVEKEKLGDEMKMALYFKGKDKAMILNKTNSYTIADGYGEETSDWFDQPLILFSVMVDFQGKVGPAIRCRVPTAKDNKQQHRRAEPQDDPISSGPVNPSSDLDDSIPFAAEFR